MIFQILGPLLLVAQVTLGQQLCPNLTMPANMLASNLSGAVGDPPVVITCDPGFKLHDDTLETTLVCEPLNATAGEWNDTMLPSCVLKECPNISLSLLPNMSTPLVADVAYVGDVVTVYCDTGTAFDVDHDKPISTRVTNLAEPVCFDVPGSLIGNWSSLAYCQVITCPMPNNVSNAFMNYSSVEYLSEVTYQCMSGHQRYYYLTYYYSNTATCNGSATWESAAWTSLEPWNSCECKKVRNYRGCYDRTCLTTTSQNTTMGGGVEDCLQYCRGQLTKFAILNGGTCYCGDDVTGCGILDDSECSASCDQFAPNSTTDDWYEPIFCGGPATEASVYHTFEGCFNIPNVTGLVPSEEVNGAPTTTCNERCRGQDATYAAAVNTTCYCFNTTQLGSATIYGTSSWCPLAVGYYNLVELAYKTLLDWSSCDDLFSEGIRMAGVYYLETPLRKEQCYFKDGTACDFGYVGWNGNCYISNDRGPQSYQKAQDFCHDLDGEVASILSLEEEQFMTQFKSVFGDELKGNSSSNNWWLGMADDTASSMFIWSDGSPMPFAHFQMGEPDQETYQCAAINVNNEWWDMSCGAKANTMCKKRPGWNYCVDLTSHPSDEWAMNLTTMSLILCTETCKGRDALYALVQNETCICTSEEAVGAVVSRADCDTPCPGQTYQQCGGIDEIYTYLNLSGRANVKSCDELNLIGLDEGDYLLEPEGENATIQHCGAPSCPYSWMSIGPHCYKAHLAQKSPAETFDLCAADNAYMLAIETEEEITTILDTMLTIAIYAGQAHWRIGLYALSQHGGLYRWANGKRLNQTLWAEDQAATNLQDVLIKSTKDNTWVTSVDFPHVSICERAEDYLGCFEPVSSIVTASISGYNKMTVQLCVERCRADGEPFAYLTSTACYCWYNVTTPSLPTAPCNAHCSGQWLQACGGSGKMSVYDVTLYPEFAETCEDLFDASIFLSGEYVVNGTLTNCTMLDGTVCDAEWVGYAGNCYKHFPKDSRTRAQACRDNAANQISLFSMDEWDISTAYLKRFYMAKDSRVFTGLNHGGYGMDVFIGQDGLLVEPGVVESGFLMPKDLYDTKGYASFRLNQVLASATDGGVICKKDKSIMGCYVLDPAIVPILVNYGSVELTQCRQLNAAHGHNVTLIGNDYCAGASYPEEALFTPGSSAACDVPCKIHKDQMCGDGTVFWAHHTVWDEVRYGENCSDLYRAGVFYESTYLLSNVVPAGTLRYETCGFSDDTHCPPNYLGKNGECVKIKKAATTFAAAASNCFKEDAYLYNPVNDTINDFVIDFVLTSELVDPQWTWHAGVWPIFYAHSYVKSNGLFVDGVHYAGATSKPEKQAGYNAQTGTWVATNTPDTRPYICQTRREFLGCKIILTAPDATYTSASNSLTMCMQWCYGLDLPYAATHLSTCACYVAMPTNMTSHTGSCSKACTAIPSQPCGGTGNTHMYSLMEIPTPLAVASSCVDLYNYGVVQPGWYYRATPLAVASSCVDLYNYGVVQPGWYYTRPDVNSSLINVFCFTEDGPYQAVKQVNITARMSSSAKAGFPASKGSFTFPTMAVWKPGANANTQYLDITMDEDRIITGLLTTGLRSAAEISYVKTYTVTYFEKITNTMDAYMEDASTVITPACNAATGVCLAYYTKPFISNKIRFYGQTWHSQISAQLMIYGQTATTFDYVGRYMGCFFDPYDEYVAAGMTGDLDDCLGYCNTTAYPFASVDDTDECYCGDIGMENGQVDVVNCPINVNGTYRTGTPGHRAVYRTYDAVCLTSNMPVNANASATTITFPYQAGVYTYFTAATYTCDPGYKYIDGTLTEISHCRQDHTWTGLTKTCAKIECMPFTVTDGAVIVASYEFQGKATVVCASGKYAENSLGNMTVTCEANKQWTIQPTCSIHNLGTTGGNLHIRFNKTRSLAAMVSEKKSASRLHCAGKCTTFDGCVGVNFRPVQRTCQLFTSVSGPAEVLEDTESDYLELIP